MTTLKEIEMEQRGVVLRYALYYAKKLGWHVFPVNVETKKPLIVDWPNKATVDEDVIHRWFFEEFRDSGIAIVCKKSGVLVFDIDNKNDRNGTAAWNELLDSQGLVDVKHGPKQTTKNGGFHIFFRHPGEEISDSLSKLGDGIDVRSNGYVIVAPSKGYEWVDGFEPTDDPMPKVPMWLLKTMTKKITAEEAEESANNGKVTTTVITTPVRKTPDQWMRYYLGQATLGNRNFKGYLLALQLHDMGLDKESALETMQKFAESVEQSPQDEYTLQEAIDSLESAYSNSPREIAKSEYAYPMLTDAANAARFHLQHKDEALVVDGKGWFFWDETRWAEDKLFRVIAMAQNTAKTIFAEDLNNTDLEYLKKKAKWGVTSLSKKGIDGMIYLARPLLAESMSNFDADPLRVNVQNGYLDVTTGELDPHSPDMRVTKISAASYDPSAECPAWLKFVDEIMCGNQEMIDYLQMILGYSITGDTSEQCLFILHGGGDNGKSTLLDVVRDVFGDYAQAAPEKFLMQGDRHSTEIADLQGARLVTADENEKGQQLAEAQVKRLTGEKKLKARFMRQDFFEFSVTHKLWIAANDKPRIAGTDHAIWRRIRLIPFNFTVTAENKDLKLPVKLIAERDGIMNWIIEGARRWLESGLTTPAEVTEATAKYRDEQDAIGQFIDDICDVDGRLEIGALMLYKSYCDWCDSRRERPLYTADFKIALNRRGFESKRKGGGIIWMGIDLRNDFIEEKSDGSYGVILGR